MAEELFFLKLNREVAKTQLAQLLNGEVKLSYKEFINKYAKEYEQQLSFEEIIDKIEINIELLSVEEFWSLFYWFYDLVKLLNPNLNYNEQEEVFRTTLGKYGMELFYEIPSKTPVRKFHSLLEDYQYHIQKDVAFKCNAEEFNSFLNYAICFSGELLLFLDKHYYNVDIHEGDAIRKKIDVINLKYGKLYHQLALKEVEETYEYNLETIKLLPPLLEFRKNTKDQPSVTYPIEYNVIMERENDLLSLANSYSSLLELKEKTENYVGLIVRLHSC